MDKIDRLLDAIEHPGQYTAAEIETMLEDPEVREVFEVLDKTKSGLRHIAIPDIESEWKTFENRNRRNGARHGFRLRELLSRNIAASVAIGLLSVTAVAAIVGYGVSRFSMPEAAVQESYSNFKPHKETAVSATGSGESEEAELVEAPEIKVFDNETLETILAEIASYYHYEVIYGNEASKSLRLYFRWDQALSIEDVAERLNNFEQIQLTVKDTVIKID